MIGPILFSIFDRKQVSLILAACIVLSPFLRLFLVSFTNVDIWRFTPARIDGICMGLLLSILLSSENRSFIASKIHVLQYTAAILLVALIPCIMFLPSKLWTSFGHSLVVLAFGCLVMVVQMRNLSGQRIRFLSLGFLRYLGLRCYSIYLFHTFFVFIAVALYDNFYVDLAIETILILSFAHFSWRYFESPLIRWGRNFPYDRKTILADANPAP